MTDFAINNPRPAPDAVAWIKITTCAGMKFAVEALEAVGIRCKKHARVPMHSRTEIEGAVWVTDPEDAPMVIGTVHAMDAAGLLSEGD